MYSETKSNYNKNRFSYISIPIYLISCDTILKFFHLHDNFKLNQINENDLYTKRLNIVKQNTGNTNPHTKKNIFFTRLIELCCIIEIFKAVLMKTNISTLSHKTFYITTDCIGWLTLFSDIF